MRRSSRESVSPWQTSKAPLVNAPLSKDIRADVCVVGAGISGLTTAHLTAVLDDRFFNLEKVFGEENARLAADSHRHAIDLIESIVKDNSIECDFERLDGYLAALTPEQEKNIGKEAEACKRAGFNPELLSQVPVPKIKAGPALRFSGQATFNIAKYMQALAALFQERGGRIFTGSRITEVKGGKNPHAKAENGYRVNADSIVVATNTPVNDWVKMHTKQAAYRTYVVAFKIPKDSYPPFLLWDMPDPYHYVRIVKGNNEDLLVVGGEDHKTGRPMMLKTVIGNFRIGVESISKSWGLSSIAGQGRSWSLSIISHSLAVILWMKMSIS